MSRRSSRVVQLNLTSDEIHEISSIMCDAYGVDVRECRLLGGESDRNVRIRAHDGTTYLLKFSQQSASEMVEWQGQLLDHLAGSCPGIPAPRLVPPRNGGRFYATDGPWGPASIRLMTWCEGSLVGEIPQVDRDLLEAWGELSGNLTRCLSDAPADLAPPTHHWDVRASREAVDDGLPYVSDLGDREAVSALVNRFAVHRPHFGELPMGVVHQDLNDFNVLACRTNGTWRISGVIDFGDALFTMRVADVAVAAAYAMLRQSDPLTAMCHVVRGYNSVLPLGADERRVIFALAGARLCVNATAWTRRTAESQHPYGQERMRFTWPAIRKIANIDESEAADAIDDACATSQEKGPR